MTPQRDKPQSPVGKPGPLRIEVIDDAQAEYYRGLTTAQRGAIALEMYNLAREGIRLQIQRLHPDWNDDQVRWELARRMAGESI